jgi:hypothetical protein
MALEARHQIQQLLDQGFRPAFRLTWQSELFLDRPSPSLRLRSMSDRSGYIIPVDYHQWPRDARALMNELHPISEGSWGIGKTLLRTQVIGRSHKASSGLTEQLSTMAWLLGMMESSALDIVYTTAEWTRFCQVTWEAFSSEGVDQAMASQTLISVVADELLKQGRVGLMGDILELGNIALPHHLVPPKYQTALIQHQPVFAVSLTLCL